MSTEKEKTAKPKKEKLLKRMGATIRAMVKCYKLAHSLDKWIVPLSWIRCTINSCYSLVATLILSKVLDMLYAGEPFKAILTPIIVASCTILALNTTSTVIGKYMNIHREIAILNYAARTGEKTLDMDYPLLDSPRSQDLRRRIQEDNLMGFGLKSTLEMIYWLPRNLGDIISSFILLWPMLTGTGIFRQWDFYVYFFLSLITYLAIEMLPTLKLNKIWLKEMEEKSIEKKTTMYYIYESGQMEYKIGKDIRLFGGQDMLEQEVEPGRKWWFKKFERYGRLNGLGWIFGGIPEYILTGGAYFYTGIKCAAGVFGVGGLYRYAFGFYHLIGSIASIVRQLTYFEVAAKRQESTLEFLSIPNEMYKGTLPVEKRVHCDGGDNDYLIEFKNVSFKYPGSEEYALRDLSMKLHIGEKLAVVGMNGSGKTTMIKLLCRLYDPTEGEITLNGIDIRKYDYEEYMRIFGVVFQDFNLFAFSLGQNVAANVEYDVARVTDCCKKSGLSLDKPGDVAHLTTETCLYKNFDESGVEISGGEAQKIALARALYKDAPFIVLDEPTAALDPIAEYEIYSKFNEIVGDKTAIYISHRLSSCRFCDDIAVFDQGCLVQRGSHDQLIKEPNGKYFELWNAQAQYYA
ncbi:MAG TPA: ABC transporter ATP-binding protein [Oscillospiraceae bacterium]|mgnify:CR=1 FL=1|nr:ABC transporter ATP-binding protein [Oscillospiraceae bacterium]HPF56646.1 ABC transporter ATP-binding protein [Clostridiales bacterium]HPK34926.1 ABC transporter ATP-binding protein [Oscillospiraceae bacterium]HPR75365.1 ABC transporter ATP-binding protein [Oscillospiraceae bacterium]